MSTAGRTTTVLDRFASRVKHDANATAMTVVASGGEAETLSCDDLYRLLRRAAAGLRSFGLRRHDVVLLSMPSGAEIVAYYLASLATGVIPLIVPGHESTASRTEALAAAAGSRLVITPEVARAGLEGGEIEVDLTVDPDDVAHLQATSGSTGVPKLAVVRHRNISANVQAIGRAVEEREGDCVVSWLPLYHDMGLICISCVLFWQRPLVLTDPANFVRHPIRYWLALISGHGGTISPAPTSAYQTCARLARRRQFEGLDLSRWRVGFCGAEPVRPRTITEFQEAFAPYGLSETTLLPVYGLAEATLAVTIPPQRSAPRFDTLDRAALEVDHLARANGGTRSITFVGLGPPLAGHEVKIVDDEGRSLPERHVGEIEVHGPSVIDGYWGALNPGGPAPLRTGDLGYVADGELFVTGRRKDIIIVHGRNLLPTEIETVVDEALASGIQNGVAAIGVMNEALATEDVHILVESRDPSPPNRELLEERLRGALSDALQLAGVHIHWIRKGSIPKTPSGKIQRSRCRELLRERPGALVS